MSPSKPNLSNEVLRTLHRLHRQLSDLRARQEQGPRRVRAAQAALAQQQKELAQAQEDLKKLRIAADQKQLQFRANEEKIKDLKRKLMTATSNREYQALRDQIAADDMANSVLADEILETLEQVDQQQKKIAELENKVTLAREKLQAVEKQLAEETPIIAADLKRAEEQLRQTETAIPVEIRDLYQRVVRQRGEDALAAIEGEYCGGCHQHVPINVYVEIKMSHPMFCKACGRLLYLAEDDSSPPARKEQSAAARKEQKEKEVV